MTTPGDLVLVHHAAADDGRFGMGGLDMRSPYNGYNVAIIT